MPLTTAELTSMRRDFEREMLTESCAIIDVTRTGTAGGYTEVETTRETVACRIGPSGLTGRELPSGGQIASRSVYSITLPAGTVIAPDERIGIGARRFDVVEIRHRTDEIVRRVLVSETT